MMHEQYKSKEELQSLTRKGLMEEYKKLFDRGSREKNAVLINEILVEQEKRRQKAVEQETSEYVEVFFNIDIDQSFGKARYKFKKGTRAKIPRVIYNYWINGAKAMRKKPPVRSVKAQMMADLRSK